MTASKSQPGTRRALLAGCLVLIAIVVSGCSSSRVTLQPDAFLGMIFQPSPAVINGIGLTVSISIIAQVVGVVLGMFAAMGKMAKLWPVRTIANFYIWFFRGTPLLVQLMFFYYGFPAAGIFQWPVITIGPLTILREVFAGTVILGINEGAYMAEIVRAGILSVDPGQTEAAKSLGMTYRLTMSRIVLPQAARVIIPPLGNEFNNMLKTTSLLTVVSVFELYNTTSVAAGHNFLYFELFAAAAVWYLLMTTIWGVVQGRIERRFAKGAAGAAAGPTGPRSEGLASRLMALRAPIEQ
jgi:polar amino acid transport system permease protein